MFQFPGFPSIRYGLAYGYLMFTQVGFPIQKSPDQRIFAPPRAYRSLSRLSSALSAKASTLRSYMLDHNQNCIFIHSSRTDSVLCSLVAGISWFFLVCFLLDNQFYLIITSDVLLNIYKF